MEKPKFEVSAEGWRLIGAAGLIFGSVCLVGIVAVIALKHTDVLASVALVLAIGAFIVQIVVSALQNTASRAAESAARGLNFETNKALEQIKASAAANQEILARQFDTLLDAVVKSSTTSGLKSEDGDVEEMAQVQDLPLSGWRPLLGAGPSHDDRRVVEELATFPDEDEAKPLLEIYSKLSPSEAAMLDRFAYNVINTREKGLEPGLQPLDAPLRNATRDSLVSKGLMEELEDGSYTLSPKGLQVARLMRAKDTPPPSVAAVLGVNND